VSVDVSGVGTLSGDPTLVLPEFDAPPPDPLALARGWLEEAVRRGIREPLAAAVATADARGLASARVLLVKGLDARGLVFGSSRGSRKGLELAVRPWASANFYWRETLQQLTIAGPVETLTEPESDEIFAQRPPEAQAASAASRQSRRLEADDEAALRERARGLVALGEPVARPADWTGYRLLPENIEFWYGSPDRLHRRLRYDRAAPDAAEWTWQRLQP
jgi:pyridoxamine 5'-phosphate oxidase